MRLKRFVLIRVSLLAVIAAALGSLLVAPAFGKAEQAPQPFTISFEGKVGESVDSPGEPVQREVTGFVSSPGFNVPVTGAYFEYQLGFPCGGGVVTSLNTCPAKLELNAAISEEFLLAIQCAIRGSAAISDDLTVQGRCVVQARNQGVHGSGEIDGTLAKDGALTFTLDGKGSCRALDPKLCPLA